MCLVHDDGTVLVQVRLTEGLTKQNTICHVLDDGGLRGEGERGKEEGGREGKGRGEGERGGERGEGKGERERGEGRGDGERGWGEWRGRGEGMRETGGNQRTECTTSKQNHPAHSHMHTYPCSPTLDVTSSNRIEYPTSLPRVTPISSLTRLATDMAATLLGCVQPTIPKCV